MTVVEAKDFRSDSQLRPICANESKKQAAKVKLFLRKTQNVVIQLPSTALHLLNSCWNGEKHTSQNGTIKIAATYCLRIQLMACELIWVFLWQLQNCILKETVYFRVHEKQSIGGLTMIVPLAILLHIWKILDSNFSPETGYPVIVIPSAISHARTQVHSACVPFHYGSYSSMLYTINYGRRPQILVKLKYEATVDD